MARFHNYSFGNVMLISRQKPQATDVAGTRTWNSLGRFVSPPAHVIHQDSIEIRGPRLNYTEQFLQGFAAFDACATFPLIDKRSDDADVVSRRIKSDCGRLIGD